MHTEVGPSSLGGSPETETAHYVASMTILTMIMATANHAVAKIVRRMATSTFIPFGDRVDYSAPAIKSWISRPNGKVN